MDDTIKTGVDGETKADDGKAKTDDGTFVVRVNGGEFSVPEDQPTALEVLKLAKKKGLMPGEPEGYYLLGDTGRYTGEGRIDVREDHVFLTIPNKATPVA